MQLQTADLVTARSVAWLWPGRFARGKLAILDGDPGLGKSLLALDLCARLTTGRPLPDGSPGPEIGNAIYLNAEDGTHDTIQPRLRALGADLKRVFLLKTEGDPADILRLPGQTTQLEDALRQTDAGLVVLDPVIAFLDSSVSDASNQSIRRALYPLAVLAEKYNALILLIRHLNKRMGGRAIYRGTGSIGFLGACRSAWLIGLDPADPSRRVLAQLKNNLAPPQPSLAFSMKPRDDGTADLCWLGESPLNAEQLLESRPAGRSKPERNKASQFLKDFLKDGPRTARDIWDAALKQGLTSRTLFRARKELDIRVGRKYEGRTHTNYWSLPQHEPVPPNAEPDEWDKLIAEMQKQFPSRTPLDDDDDDF